MLCRAVAEDYPQIVVEDWYVDIMAANLVDPATRSRFQVFLLPNLYGDILTDEAAQLQGDVGTAGSANIGTRYAMFDAIHGTAPRLIAEGKGDYANPTSILRAAAMLLRHIGRQAGGVAARPRARRHPCHTGDDLRADRRVPSRPSYKFI